MASGRTGNKRIIEPEEISIPKTTFRALVPCFFCGQRPITLKGNKVKCPGCGLIVHLDPKLVVPFRCKKPRTEDITDTLERDWNNCMQELETKTRDRSNRSHTMGSAAIKDSDYDYTGIPDEASQEFEENQLQNYDSYMDHLGKRRLGYGNQRGY